MNLLVRNSLPSMLMDWPMPGSLFGSDFLDNNFNFPTGRLGVNVPSVNVSETPKEFKIEMAAPGLERKDFNIEVENHSLCISAEKEETVEEKKEDEFTRREYSFNSFSRSFTLPENVKENEIDAKYDNGVLKVVVPKVKESAVKATRKIAVS